MRVWIEISLQIEDIDLRMFHPLMRVWIEIQYIRDNKKVPKFHPLMRVWIEIPWWTTFKRMKATVSPSYEGVD